MGGASSFLPRASTLRRGGARHERHSQAWGLLVAVVLMGAVGAYPTSLSASTSAGTVVTNTATASWDTGTASSNRVDLTVLQKAGVAVSPLTGSNNGRPGESVYFAAVLTNTGNGADTVGLSAVSSHGWPCQIYRDDNADGVHQSTEVSVVTSTGSLASGQSFYCVVAIAIPAGATGSDSTTLTGTSSYDPARLATATYTINVQIAPPVADFSASPTTGNVPLTVVFSDSSTGTPSAWSWGFGDGSTSTTRNPTHVYSAAGTYTVSLTVGNTGGQDTKTKTGLISATEPSPPAPTADFAASPTTGQAPLTVSFSDHSTGAPTSWSWAFGDGGTSTAQNPTHQYARSGSYTVMLTATNAQGQDTEIKTGYIAVSDPPPPAPAADFAAAPTSGQAPLTVSFTDLSTGAPTSWQWSFGDGGTSSDSNPSHVYTNAGSYTVSLTVANAGGQDTAAKSDCVAVEGAQPTADFEAVPASGSAPLLVDFRDLSAGQPTAWQWDFGDGNTAKEKNPSHVYESAGSFRVSLIVATPGGNATKVKDDCVLVGYSDVLPGRWGYSEIMACVEAGIMSGYPDGKFHPNWSVTRDQIAASIARALTGGDENVPQGPATPSFSDVPPDYWAYKYIEYAKAADIVSGYEDGLYQPTKQLDRGTLAVFVARAIVVPTGDEGLAGYTPPSTPTFRDVTPTRKTAWCYKYVEYLASRGITDGFQDTRYRPTATVARDEVAVFLARGFALAW